MQDWLVDPAPDPENLLAEAEDRIRVRTALKDALARLTAPERHIILARFLAEHPTTLEDLGASFSVSRKRICQIKSAPCKSSRALCALTSKERLLCTDGLDLSRPARAAAEQRSQL